MRAGPAVQRSVRDFFGAAATAKRPADAGTPSPSAKKRAAVTVAAAAADGGGAPGTHGGAPTPPPALKPAPPSPPRDRAAAAATASEAVALVARRVATVQANGIFPALADLLVEEGWRAALAGVLTPRTVAPLHGFLEGEWAGKAPVYPPKHLIFRALNEVPLASVRVVIIGQDPYHGPGQAEGLSFSVPRGVAVPPSLRNIHKELAADIPAALPRFPPGHGSLAAWAGQGVLLLNATLTVRAAAANSHAGKGWEVVTDAAIAAVAARPQHTVFLLWGKFAQAKARLVRAGGRHHTILEAPHPSGLSAHRGFFGCRHFSKANEALVKAGGEPVDWSL